MIGHAETIARLDAENKAAGRCIDCGGSGVVANLQAIDRTGDPHINRRCFRCKGDGKYRDANARKLTLPPPNS